MLALAHPQGHRFTPDVACSLMPILGQLEGHLFTPNVNFGAVFRYSHCSCNFRPNSKRQCVHCHTCTRILASSFKMQGSSVPAHLFTAVPAHWRSCAIRCDISLQPTALSLHNSTLFLRSLHPIRPTTSSCVFSCQFKGQAAVQRQRSCSCCSGMPLLCSGLSLRFQPQGRCGCAVRGSKMHWRLAAERWGSRETGGAARYAV